MVNGNAQVNGNAFMAVFNLLLVEFLAVSLLLFFFNSLIATIAALLLTEFLGSGWCRCCFINYFIV